eukprot:CAMPEP_0179941562 /NCGR_PEP_ID=MMETSP0983-20121128/17057_1 /TAXON_ID=483367 /ORGANISM="non described non described, Strain CCMP 2436" /LENGTH=64 /DNA_ID=CAMNT_0021848621 /DNA_START=542 /DNA_END=736 /DNA_ORIENTATION=-
MNSDFSKAAPRHLSARAMAAASRPSAGAPGAPHLGPGVTAAPLLRLVLLQRVPRCGPVAAALRA